MINIKGMNMVEVSDKIMPYLAAHFKHSQLAEYEHGIFQETYTLEYSEINHLVPDEYKGQFRDDDTFMCSSGCVYFADKQEFSEEIEYFAMLVASGDSSKALFLYVCFCQ